MNSIIFILLVVSITSNNALPAREGYYNLNFLYDDLYDNSIDGQTIDVSSLGPEAYGLPNNESGEY